MNMKYGVIKCRKRISYSFKIFETHIKFEKSPSIIYGLWRDFFTNISVNINPRMISFWENCSPVQKTKPKNKIVHILYKYLSTKYNNEIFKNQYIDFIVGILFFDNCEVSNIWNEQGIVNVNWITKAVKQRIKDQFVQKWSVNILNSSKVHIHVCKFFEVLVTFWIWKVLQNFAIKISKSIC